MNETINRYVKKTALNEVLKYVEKDPMNHLGKICDWGDRVVKADYQKKVLHNFRSVIDDKSSNWYELLEKLFEDTDDKSRDKFLVNFLVNATVFGLDIRKKNMAKYQINVPWAILMDPTAACNLQCTGCWASDYKKTTSMTYDELDNIISQGKAIGTYVYLYSGGEPLMRKNDLIRLAEKHDDCYFISFTNGTLVDEDFANELLRVGNLSLAFSVEGFEEETDMRRGEGTYQKVIDAMRILKNKGLIYGYSTCYHSKNYECIGSEAYTDYMIELGCSYGWYFTYMPVGNDAVVDLMSTSSQRKYMYDKIREYRKTKPVFTLDFWNDGEAVSGCIAGGRNYLHINSNGDYEPCAFIHYSDSNIRDYTLIEALKRPLFQSYKANQPFNNNHLRPCPLLDNPEALKMMVKKSGAFSTQLGDPEDVVDLTEKCKNASQEWGKVADQIWLEKHGNNAL